jgi:hypothetical protein
MAMTFMFVLSVGGATNGAAHRSAAAVPSATRRRRGAHFHLHSPPNTG